MAIGIIMQFDGLTQTKYEAVMKELNLKLHADANWPEGIVSHTAGKSPNGWCVVDVWESEAAFGKFRETRLQPAFGKVGNMPEPKVTKFEVQNRFPA